MLIIDESESEVAQSCPTLCHPMDFSLSGSSIHGIFQARVLEWIVISFSRGSEPPRKPYDIRSDVQTVNKCYSSVAHKPLRLPVEPGVSPPVGGFQ